MTTSMVCSIEKLTNSHLCVAQLSQFFYAFTLIGGVITHFLFIFKIQHCVE